jgi:class 3 adenylate cyclase
MANVRSTVIMKTDLCGFTSRVQTLPETDLSDLLNFHKEFTSEMVIRYEGQIIKGEGDSFWMIFPSVTNAALAAVEVQKELKLLQATKGYDHRLRLRIAITLGDILYQDGDIFGDAVNLAARVESITPADETYLSQAAYLALNKAEITTEFVDTFLLKGMKESEKIYRVVQKYKTRIVRDEILVFTDIRKMNHYFDSFSDETQSIQAIELLLTQLEEYIKDICQCHEGRIQLIICDTCLLTFSDASSALAALESLQHQWDSFIKKHQIPCPISIGVHKGTLYLFRSTQYGQDVAITSRIASINNRLAPAEISSIAVSEKILQDLVGTVWEEKLHELEGGDCIDIYRTEHKLYQLR